MAFMGMEWIIVIIAIVLLLFGAKKVPEFARNIGKATGEFKKGKMMVQREIQEAERSFRDEERRSPQASADDPEEGAGRSPAPRDSPVRRAASELGIETDGRTDDELKTILLERVGSDEAQN